MNPTVTHAPSAALAAAIAATLTVEAEYGSFVAEGTKYTAAHHQADGPYAGRHVVAGGRPSPCNDPAIPVLGADDTIIISHIDLDTVGGCLRAFAAYADLFEESNAGFWNLAEFLDVSGAHKMGAAGATDEDTARIYAWWAWFKTGAPRFARDAVADATAVIVAAGDALRRILADDADMLGAGAAFRADEAALNSRTFVRREGDVIVRTAATVGDFCNHLYTDPSGAPARAVVCLNTASRTVTVSLADPDKETVSCRDFVQNLWGPEAGGHKGIAGGPRGVPLDESHRDAAVWDMVDRLG
jgi:hypothetical protein